MPANSMRQIDAGFWGQALVQGLEVTGDLFGEGHRFEFEGHRVEIAMPAVVLGEDLRPIDKQRHVAEFSSGLVKNPTRATNSYAISYFDAAVMLPDPLLVPQALLDLPPKRPEIAGPALSARLDELTIEYEQRLANAVAHWKDVVNWITGSRAIDTPNGLSGRESEMSFRFKGLVVPPGQVRFWMPTSTVAFQKRTKLDKAMWTTIGLVLAAGHDVPVWSRLLDGAYRYLQNRDVSGCILSAAIACETLAKQTNALLPVRSDGTPNTHPSKKKPSMAIVLSNWAQLTGINDHDARTVEIRELVGIRNELMHEGSTKRSVDHEMAKRLFAAATQFICEGEDIYYRQKGVRNPRR